MMKAMLRWLRGFYQHDDVWQQEQCPLGLMATKSLIVRYPHQDEPDAPNISLRQMDLLDAFCCADCEAPLAAPYDLPCGSCGSTFHLHEE